jgi:TRAP-type uncharacterized transport system substrate-binding protein
MRVALWSGGGVAFAVSLLACALGAGALGAYFLTSAQAQTVPRSLDEGGPDAVMKARKNAWTLGVAGGLQSGTYMTYATELAQVLDDGDNLRILPIVTYGAASNLDDSLYLRNVDVAVVQSDVFEYFRTHRKISNLQDRVHYIIRLPASEMQILARDHIKSLADLRDRKVNFGPAGSGSSLTGTIVFQRLNIRVEQTLFDSPTAMQKLKAGEIDALIRVIGKPIDYFAKIPANSGLRFVPIPFSKTFADYYAIGELTHEDYPTLVAKDQPVDTLRVPTVLAVFNWGRGTDRYRRVERFVEALFSKWDKFREPPRHLKWREVNLNATVPGWTRLALATDILNRIRPNEGAQARSDHAESSTLERGRGPKTLSEDERETLFREFLRWRERQRAQQ